MLIPFVPENAGLRIVAGTNSFSHEPMHVVEKTWGKEVWVWNDKSYCGKFLYINANCYCSFHKHLQKKEDLFMQSGICEFIIHDPKVHAPNTAKTIVLHTGNGYHIEPGVIHRMRALEAPVVIAEFSTQHFDHDSIRIDLNTFIVS